MAASVRRLLLDIIRRTGVNPNDIWTRYASERLLYRLSVSDQCDSFILKGAMLLIAWTGELHRPTADLDLLGYGMCSEERLGDIFRRICIAYVEPDGLVFDADSINVVPIRGKEPYHGQRITLTAFLPESRSRLMSASVTQSHLPPP